MTYHLSRVAHWAQNGTLAHYPTHIFFQDYRAPWAETAILQSYVLAGSDRFAALVQWFSMIGSVITVSLIARGLGASPRGQILAALVCATIPMGVLQGSSTQNDYATAFWLTTLAYFGLRAMDNRGAPALVVGAGLSLGLAILTKATAYLYAVPLLLWVGCWGVVRLRCKVYKPLFVVGLLVAALNLGHWWRNSASVGFPLGPISKRALPSAQKMTDYTRHINEDFSVANTISNLLRNVSLHLTSPSKDVNVGVEGLVRWVHRVCRLDPDNAKTTLGRYHVPRLKFHEDTTGMPAHLLLFGVCLAALGASSSLRRESRLLLYSGVIVVGFVLFCTFLKWNAYHARLQLPLFVLGSPLVAVVLQRIRNRRPVVIVAVVLVGMSVPCVFVNRSRSTFGSLNIFTTSRSYMYFRNHKDMYPPETAAADFVADRAIHNVGLICGRNDLEYPLWVLLKNRNLTFRLEHVNVTNRSRDLPYPLDAPTHGQAGSRSGKGFVPGAIICLNDEQADVLACAGRSYRKALSKGPVSVFIPQHSGRR